MKLFSKAKTKKQEDENDFSIREFFELAVWNYKLGLKHDAKNLILITLIRPYEFLQPLIYSFLFSRILDLVINAFQDGTYDPNDFLIYAGGFTAFLAFSSVFSIFLANRRLHFEQGFYAFCNRELYTKVYSLGVEVLEQPEFSNKLQRADDQVWAARNILRETVYVFSAFVSIVISAVLIANVNLWIMLGFILLIIPKFFLHKYFLEIDYKLYYDNTEIHRSTNASAHAMTQSSSLKEVLMTRAYNFLDHKYYEWNGKKYPKMVAKNRDKWDVGDTTIILMNQGLVFLGLFDVLKKLGIGAITVGDLAFNFSLFNNFFSKLDTFMIRVIEFYQSALRFKDYKAVFDQESIHSDGKFKLQLLPGVPPTIEFRNVSFKYPNSDKYVIKNFNLTIESGQNVALVGENGAGKTTLVKLLTRMYRPESGEIYINGQNINEIKMDDLYRKMAVVFQEFNKYEHLSAEDNIYMGRSYEKIDRAAIKDAAKKSDSWKFINEFPKKMDQILSERYEKGIRPSGGQWQKIALARFFYKDAPIAIFDEPTAAIDAIAESKIFNRIYKFFDQKTILIISHRFSTVRNADRIIVLRGGKVVEEGSHSQLIAKDGYYKKAFNVQAKGYKD